MRLRFMAVAVFAVALAACGKTGAKAPAVAAVDTTEIAKQAYVYGFPMVAFYKALYSFNVDTTSPEYKGPFNTIVNEHRVFTPADKAIPTPNSDTPYSILMLDVRAEPMVVCVPAVDPKRYYSVQFSDLYTFNVGYIGSRATGSKAGCYGVAGPGWTGDTPAGLQKVIVLGTHFGIAIFRTQLFGPSDMPNVVKVQNAYKVTPLSTFLKQPAPAAAPSVAWPRWSEAAFKAEFPAYLAFLLQFAPGVASEDSLRARFASIGIVPGQPFDAASLSDSAKAKYAAGLEAGFKAIEARVGTIGKDENGWRVGSAFGDRAFYKGDYELRAAAAMAGIFGNDAVEALYPLNKGLDASATSYTLTFPAGQLPPVNAFWSVTMYDGKDQLLISNPINRYLINAPMLPRLRKNADGSLTLYIQKDSPGKDKESNWLPAPNGPMYIAMRLYWPKEEALNGTWSPPAIVPAK